MGIEKLEGIELDIEVATNVMKWHEWKNFEDGDYCGEYPMFYFDDSGFGIYVYKDINGPDRHFAPSRDIAAAWQVHQTAREWLFSKRSRYLRNLQEVVSRRMASFGSERIAWPDVMMFLQPEDFCRAALMTVEEMENER